MAKKAPINTETPPTDDCRWKDLIESAINAAKTRNNRLIRLRARTGFEIEVKLHPGYEKATFKEILGHLEEGAKLAF